MLIYCTPLVLAPCSTPQVSDDWPWCSTPPPAFPIQTPARSDLVALCRWISLKNKLNKAPAELHTKAPSLPSALLWRADFTGELKITQWHQKHLCLWDILLGTLLQEGHGTLTTTACHDRSSVRIVSVEHCFLPAVCVLCFPHCSSLVLLPQFFSFPLFLCSVTTLCQNLIFYSYGAIYLPCHSPQLLIGLFPSHPYFTLQDTFLIGLFFQTDENLIKFMAIPAGIVCARHLDEEILFLKFT